MKNRISRSFNYIVALAAMVCFGLLAVYMGQDYSWDLRNYHYYNAYAFLNNRLFFDFGPGSNSSFFNPIIELPFYLLASNLPPKWTTFFMGAIHSLSYLFVYLMALTIFAIKESRLFIEDLWRRRVYALICALAATFGTINISELGTTFNDNLTGLIVLGSILIIVRTQISPEKRSSKRALLNIGFAGIVLGFAAASKLTNALFVLGSFLAIPSLRDSLKERLKFLVVWGSGVGVGFVMLHGYWSLQLWRRFGNPRFSFFNNFFKSPYALIVYHRDASYLAPDIIKTLFFPFHFITTSRLADTYPFRDMRYAVVYVLVVAAIARLIASVASKRAQSPVTSDVDRHILQFFSLFFVSSYIVWQEHFSIYRYSVVLEFVAPIVIVILIAYLLKNVSRRSAAITALVIFVTMIATVKYPAWGRIEFKGSTYFGVKVPAIEFPEDSIVLAVSHLRPTAFLIPSFPKHVRFLNIVGDNDSRVLSLSSKQHYVFNKDTKMFTDTLEFVEKHTGPKYVILPSHSKRSFSRQLYEEVAKALDTYGLRMVYGTCRSIETNNPRMRDAASMSICEVKRKSAR